MATTQPRKTAARKTAPKKPDRRKTIGFIDALRDCQSDLDNINERLIKASEVSQKVREAMMKMDAANLLLSEAEDEFWLSLGA